MIFIWICEISFFLLNHLNYTVSPPRLASHASPQHLVFLLLFDLISNSNSLTDAFIQGILRWIIFVYKKVHVTHYLSMIILTVLQTFGKHLQLFIKFQECKWPIYYLFIKAMIKRILLVTYVTPYVSLANVLSQFCTHDILYSCSRGKTMCILRTW